MRIIIITIGLLCLTACTHTQYQNQYSLFAEATKITAQTMRENIKILQALEIEAQKSQQALSFVRDKTNSLEIPESLLSDAMNQRLQFLQNLEKAVDSIPRIKSTNQLALALHEESHQKQIHDALQKSHAEVQKIISKMVIDWNSKALQDLPKDIVARIDGHEKKLLLIARGQENTDILALQKMVLQHLQKQEQRKLFLRNWQAIAKLCEKMQQAHVSLRHADMRAFYESALLLQQNTERFLSYE